MSTRVVCLHGGDRRFPSVYLPSLSKVLSSTITLPHSCFSPGPIKPSGHLLRVTPTYTTPLLIGSFSFGFVFYLPRSIVTKSSRPALEPSVGLLIYTNGPSYTPTRLSVPGTILRYETWFQRSLSDSQICPGTGLVFTDSKEPTILHPSDLFLYSVPLIFGLCTCVIWVLHGSRGLRVSTGVLWE